jgi:coenzyme PQQ precursor peptide PqqA
LKKYRGMAENLTFAVRRWERIRRSRLLDPDDCGSGADCFEELSVDVPSVRLSQIGPILFAAQHISPQPNGNIRFYWRTFQPVLLCVVGTEVAPARARRVQMAWKAPKIVEVPVGMEINMYACAARK